MDFELDLGVYLAQLRRHWLLIAGLGVVAAVAAAVISMFLPPVYEASALVSVASPRFSLRLEGVTEAADLPVRAYHDLALSDAVVNEVFGRVRAALPPEEDTLTEFAQQLELATASDITLLRLTARDADPVRAATIANAWAEVFTALAGRLYGQDQANVAQYEVQLAGVKAQLDAAQQALADFQATNETNFLTARLTSQRTVLADYLSRQHEVELLLEDARGLQTRLAELNASDPAGQAEEVALVSIASLLYGGRAFTSVTETVQSVTPLLFQLVPGQGATGATVADQRALAANLLANLEGRREFFGTAIADLRPEILALQGELAAAQLAETDLQLNQELAEQQYTTLALKVQQAGIAVQESNSIAQIASPALAPTEPAGPRTTLNIALGGAIGLALGALAALAVEARRGLSQTPPEAPQPAA